MLKTGCVTVCTFTKRHGPRHKLFTEHQPHCSEEVVQPCASQLACRALMAEMEQQSRRSTSAFSSSAST